MDSRTCNQCAQTLPLSAYNRRTHRGKVGYQYKCRECQRSYKQKWYEDNRKHCLDYRAKLGPAYMREYRKRPEVRAHQRAYDAQYLQEHLPEKRRKESRRRAKKYGNFIEDVHPMVVLKRDNGVCGICQKEVDPSDFHVDHIVPLVFGGEHSYANTQAAHPACNLRKGWSK